MSVPVTKYHYAWNVRRKVGEVEIHLSNGEMGRGQVSTLADLAGWAAILSTGRAVSKGNGWIGVESGSELVAKFGGGEVPFPF